MCPGILIFLTVVIIIMPAEQNYFTVKKSNTLLFLQKPFKTLLLSRHYKKRSLSIV